MPQFRTQTVSQTTTSDLNPCLREIAVEVPAEEVAGEMETVLRKYQKLVRMPGFRKGKVPASVVRQRFAAELRSELIEQLVPRFFRAEAEKRHLQPVSEPQVSDIEWSEGQPLKFKASFEVMPPIEVTGWQELRAERADISVSDAEVEAELGRLRDQHAKYTVITGSALGDGDFAEVSFTGMPAEEGAKPVSMDDVLVEIGGAATVPEFTENLRGASAGDERRFEVHYPGDFSDPRLANKAIAYSVKVKAIKQKELPPLADDFAKALGDFASLADLRQRLRTGLEQEKQARAEREAKEKLLDELLRRNQFPVPEALVERQVDTRLERGLRSLAAQGLKTEDMKKMDLPRLRAGQRQAAARDVKSALILERIAEAEKIQVADQEIDDEIAALARDTRQTVEALRARLTREGALDRIRNRIRNDKTLDFLYRRTA